MEKDSQAFKHMDPETVKAISYGFGMSYNLLDELVVAKAPKAPSLQKEPEIMSDILNMSTEQMAEYADVVSKGNYDKITFLEDQLPPTYMGKYTNITDTAFNPTSIGNIAYLAAYAPAPYANRAAYLLDLILDAYSKKTGRARTAFNTRTIDTNFVPTSFCALI